MTSPAVPVTDSACRATPPDALLRTTSAHDSSALARRILLAALLLGVAGDALLRSGVTGPGVVIWIALAGLSAISLAHRARHTIPLEAVAWLAAAVLFAIGMAWRDSATLQFFDAVAVAGSITLAGVAFADDRAALFAERLRDTVGACIALVRQIIIGVVPLAVRDAAAATAARRRAHSLAVVARVVIIAGVLLLVFGSLLRSADPIFASLVRLPDVDVGEVASHVFLVAFFTAVTAGWARGAFVSAHRVVATPATAYVRLGRAETTAALGTLLVLFGAFLAAQTGWLFGGERFLRERTGLTAAEYARSGFFQMMWVVGLVVPVLAATRAMLDPADGPPLRRRHARLALPLIVLLGLMIVSAFLRMRLYVRYYGLTTDRFYPIVAMIWLAFVLVWVARTVLRDWTRPFAAGVVISGLVTLATLNVIAPDVIVAKVNLRRAAPLDTRAGRVLDVRHLSTLSGEAVPLATDATLTASRSGTLSAEAGDVVPGDAQLCDASRLLLRRWGPSSRAAYDAAQDGSWRSWNAGAAAAIRAVGANASALRSVQHETCPRVRARERAPGQLAR